MKITEYNQSEIEELMKPTHEIKEKMIKHNNEWIFAIVDDSLKNKSIYREWLTKTMKTGGKFDTDIHMAPALIGPKKDGSSDLFLDITLSDNKNSIHYIVKITNDIGKRLLSNSNAIIINSKDDFIYATQIPLGELKMLIATQYTMELVNKMRSN